MNRCVCGAIHGNIKTVPCVTVTESGTYQNFSDGMDVITCVECGLIRKAYFPYQSNEEMKKFYSTYPPTKKEYSVKNFQHDLQVASARIDSYGFMPGDLSKVLDVGSGSGAFVYSLSVLGIETYGCEISAYADANEKGVYAKALEDIHFPTDHFDVVTCHDVLEHVLDPKSFIREMVRVLKMGGLLYIEIPNFHSSEGRHHWKTEHLWYFNVEHIEWLVGGCTLQSVTKPIATKLSFCFKKDYVQRPTILLPPGIGDSYWSITKLQSFLKSRDLIIPEVTVVCPREKKHNGHQRAIPFLEMFPFVSASWNTLEANDPAHKEIWKEAYAEEGRTIFQNVLGCDYFISYNGHLRVGKEMDVLDPELETNWFPPMFQSLEQISFSDYFLKRHGRFVVFYFVFQGTYRHWTSQFSIDSVVKSVQQIVQSTGLTPVFVGGRWDAEDASLTQVVKQIRIPHVNLIGKTSVAQLFGLLRSADLVVGYPSGLTIMSSVLKAKTLVIWNDYYHRKFAWACMPPEVRRKTYFAENTWKLTPEIMASRSVELLSGEFSKDREIPKLPTVSHTSYQASPATGRKRKYKGVVKTQIVRPLMSPSPTYLELEKGSPSVTVVSVLRSKGEYTVDHVNRLFNAVQRNSTLPVRYACLSDVTTGFNQNIEVIPLITDWPGWWAKVELFRKDLFFTDRVMFFDLDTVITANIDSLLSIESPHFVALLPWNPKNRASGGFASGAINWENGRYLYLFNDFDLESALSQGFSGDQHYMYAQMLRKNESDWAPLQSGISGIYSYRRNCRYRLPNDARIVCFHGKPRPWEVTHHWTQENWK